MSDVNYTATIAARYVYMRVCAARTKDDWLYEGRRGFKVKLSPGRINDPRVSAILVCSVTPLVARRSHCRFLPTALPSPLSAHNGFEIKVKRPSPGKSSALRIAGNSVAPPIM